MRGKQCAIWAQRLAQLCEGGNVAHDGENVFTVLRISVEALTTSERDMFLDVACMFARQPADDAMGLWKG